MEVEWGTVLVSAAITVATGVVAFVFATRVAKDQSDRETMRAIYRRLHAHFGALGSAINSHWPRSWNDFPLKAGHYEPPVRAMKLDGEIALLPEKFSKRLEILEERVLKAGSVYRNWVQEAYLPAAQQLVRNRTVGRNGPISMRPYSQLHLAHLPMLSAQELLEQCNRIERDGLGLGLETLVERGRSFLIYVYPELIIDGGTIRQLLFDLRNLARTDREGEAAVAALELEEVAIAAELKILARRVRDPHPIWRSVVDALQDLRPSPG